VNDAANIEAGIFGLMICRHGSTLLELKKVLIQVGLARKKICEAEREQRL